jgi:hypothetical protein
LMNVTCQWRTWKSSIPIGNPSTRLICDTAEDHGSHWMAWSQQLG